MRVNLVAADNGAGLSRDMRLLAAVLEEAGMDVTVTALRRGKLRKWLRPLWVRAGNLIRRLSRRRPPFCLNLMQEHIRSEYLSWAERNALVPNPEYLLASDRALLARMDRVLVKTRHAHEIFTLLGSAVEYVGFTSEDRLDDRVTRKRAFFHLAGKSGNKGTEAVIAAWRQHPHWPHLTVVQNSRSAKVGAHAPNLTHLVEYLPDHLLKEMQNAHQFHLCPSETEGFGHYLMESMSVGAVTLTTDGAPMNELVSVERGVLIPVAATGQQAAAKTWIASAAEIAESVERVLALDESQLEKFSKAGRQYFLQNDQDFRERLIGRLKEWLLVELPTQLAAGQGLAEPQVKRTRISFRQVSNLKRRRKTAGASGVQPKTGSAEASVERRARNAQRL